MSQNGRFWVIGLNNDENLKNDGLKVNVVKIKSFLFAKRVVFCSKYLKEEKEYILSKQLLRSGTAVGALIREAEMAESRKDFVQKMHIAHKEANETLFWIDLLLEAKLLDKKIGISLRIDADELLNLLVRIVKTSEGK